ncbi:MAG: DinB family protein, partial [Xanthobacteraceae bacterium]
MEGNAVEAGHSGVSRRPDLHRDSHQNSRDHWLKAFGTVRAETERRAALLSAEDQVVQSMPDASPTKWHRAHVTWFFEQFLLRPHAKTYRVFDERFGFLYNSYYVSAGPRQARPQRGLVTRPSAAEVAAYRAHVDDAVADLIATARNFDELRPIVEIGLQHEQQHQELLFTDILHAFSLNETHPVYDPAWQWPRSDERPAASAVLDGVHTIGHASEDFCFDNERPAHQVLLQQVWLSPSLVTNGEWLEFMADGGYTTPTLWLSDGWTTVEAQGWAAPGYWRKVDGAW